MLWPGLLAFIQGWVGWGEMADVTCALIYYKTHDHCLFFTSQSFFCFVLFCFSCSLRTEP